MLDNAATFDVRAWLRLQAMPHFLCPGCGHGIALRALLWALDETGIDQDHLAVVSGMAHRVALMYAGQIIEMATADEFFSALVQHCGDSLRGECGLGDQAAV